MAGLPKSALEKWQANEPPSADDRQPSTDEAIRTDFSRDSDRTPPRPAPAATAAPPRTWRRVMVAAVAVPLVVALSFWLAGGRAWGGRSRFGRFGPAT